MATQAVVPNLRSATIPRPVPASTVRGQNDFGRSAALFANFRSPTVTKGRPCADRHRWDVQIVGLLPLVRQVAMRIRLHLPAHANLEDLIGAGVLGLLDAVEKYDPRQHTKLESYAQHRIRGSILDSLRSLDWVSRDLRKKYKRAERLRSDLENRLGRAAGDDEMADALGVSLKQWHKMNLQICAAGVEQAPRSTSGELDVDHLPAPGGENPFVLCYRREQRDILAKLLQHLPERERSVVELYYLRELTMKQIGAILGVDESRISQIHAAAVLRLRGRVRALLTPFGPPRVKNSSLNRPPSQVEASSHIC